MKKVKILLLFLLVATATFYSCTDNNPVENEAVASKSIALRSTLNAVKKANNVSGKTTLTTQDQAFCFNFVYPITLSYNNGTQITVANFEGLLEILVNENNDLYIDGIVFPFQVQEEGTITTIDNEAEFYALLQDCNTIQTVNDFAFDFSCYSIVFPIQIINANNETVTITTQAQLMQYISTPTGTSTYQLNLVFPFSVTQNNQTILINDIYEFFELNNDCTPSSDCFCAEIYQPVCVWTPTGVVQYANACFAECDGFTQNDFADCSSSCICPTVVDPVCVQTATGLVQYENACRAMCDGFTSADFVNCDGTTNPIDFGTGLGNCFTVSFPVQVQHEGALVTANNNTELLQYYNPSWSSIPPLVYPVSVTFLNGTPTGMNVTITSQAGFEAAIANNCN